MAMCLAHLGELHTALDELEKSVAIDQSGNGTMKVEPMFEPLKNEPRYQALPTRMGLNAEF